MVRQTLEAVDTAFRAARLVLDEPTPPTRFYLNLSERCQLRCAHCITHAPALTDAGTARSMSDAVLAALRPSLRYAHYVGLTHAGEPTLAPGLDALLALLREVRGDAAPVVHVVSNGMALTERRFRELVLAGISSFSFSVDGVSAETNDALRLGARVVVLMRRLAQFAALRTAERLDVRLGVSFTITRSNVHEVAAMARFVISSGLDCLKLEETFPVNERSRQEALLSPAAVRAAVDEAQRLCAAAGVRLVDHTVRRTVWKCRPSPMSLGDATFSASDDFSNRLDINPCRAPWEVVCIEPNGDVKPDNFHQQPVGNVLESDLLTLWNHEAFLSRRRLAVFHRRCGADTSCPADPGPQAW